MNTNVDAVLEAIAEELKTIVYLHGFGSSEQSGTVKHLRKVLPQFNVLAPDIPICPSEALPFLKDFCEKYHPDLIIGTGLGGMYAMQMHDYKRMCMNPALRMSELTDILKPGTFKYFQPTQNGDTNFTITEDIIQQFREMESHMFDGVNDDNHQMCWGFFGDNDTTVNCREEFELHFAPNVETFHGGHRMNNKVINEVVLPFVENLLGCRNSKYKKGDWVKFISDQPSVYLSRYADDECKIEKEEHVGIIKNVHTIMKGWYSYAIITTPIKWICYVDEEDISGKLSIEYKMENSDELYGYMWLKPDLTGINADIFVDDGKAYLRDNHVPLLFVRNGIGREITEFIPISISETPTILDETITIGIDKNIIKQIMVFIKANIYTLMAMANEMVGTNDFVSTLKLTNDQK